MLRRIRQCKCTFVEHFVRVKIVSFIRTNVASIIFCKYFFYKKKIPALLTGILYAFFKLSDQYSMD